MRAPSSAAIFVPSLQSAQQSVSRDRCQGQWESEIISTSPSYSQAKVHSLCCQLAQLGQGILRTLQQHSALRPNMPVTMNSITAAMKSGTGVQIMRDDLGGKFGDLSNDVKLCEHVPGGWLQCMHLA